MESLQELGIKHGTDKATVHGYLPIYEQYFRNLRDQHISLLEIGIAKGHSLRMWKEYFPHAVIYGLDVNYECQLYSQDRIIVKIGDSTNLRMIKEFFQNDMFDIIIDDGSHNPMHQIMSYCVSRPKLKTNGMYFIEDICGNGFLFEPLKPIVHNIKKNGKFNDVLLALRK